MLLVRVVNDQTGEVWNAELPDKDFLIVACQYSEAHKQATEALASQNSIMRVRKASTLADQALTALGDMPLLVLKDVPEGMSKP